MIPASAFTVLPDTSVFIPPFSDRYKPFEMRTRGGAAIGNASQGRDTQYWKVKYAGAIISVGIYAQLPVFTLAVTGIETVSLAFDNNMGITLAWQIGSTSTIYYFDTIALAYITKTFTGTTSCRICVDDERSFNNANSDVIFAYTTGSSLHWRQQRDRYDVEYTVGPTTKKIRRLAPNSNRRLQFELK